MRRRGLEDGIISAAILSVRDEMPKRDATLAISRITIGVLPRPSPLRYEFSSLRQSRVSAARTA